MANSGNIRLRLFLYFLAIAVVLGTILVGSDLIDTKNNSTYKPRDCAGEYKDDIPNGPLHGEW